MKPDWNLESIPFPLKQIESVFENDTFHYFAYTT